MAQIAQVQLERTHTAVSTAAFGLFAAASTSLITSVTSTITTLGTTGGREGTG